MTPNFDGEIYLDGLGRRPAIGVELLLRAYFKHLELKRLEPIL